MSDTLCDLGNGLISTSEILDTHDFRRLFRDTRAIVTETYRELSLEYLAYIYADLAQTRVYPSTDSRGGGVLNDGGLILDAARDSWDIQQRNLTPDAPGRDPLRCEIFFGFDASGKYVLAYVKADDAAYLHALIEARTYRDYFYDPDTRPRDIDEQDWNTRRQDWDVVFDGHDSLDHLLNWSVTNSVTDMFTQFYNLAPAPHEAIAAVDLNSYYTPKSRLTDQLRDAICRRVLEINKVDEITDPSTNLEMSFEAMSMGLIHSADIIAELDEDTLADLLPAPLPGVYAHVHQLPAPVIIPDWLMPNEAKLVI